MVDDDFKLVGIICIRDIVNYTWQPVKSSKKGTYATSKDPIEITIKSLGTSAGLWPKPITRVRVLGSEEKLQWSREGEHLRVKPLQHWPSAYALVFEIV